MDHTLSVASIKNQIKDYSEEHGPLLNSSSAKDKYSELVKGPSFFLFSKYQKLLKSFKCADQVLCMLDKHNTSSGAFLSDLSLRVLRNFNCSFGEKQLGQIKYLKSDLYDVAWGKNETLQVVDLLVQIPKDENCKDDSRSKNARIASGKITLEQVNLRLKVVEKLLLDVIRKEHDKFLERKKHSEKEFSYGTQSTWHSEFDPEKYLDDIPQAELPPRPSKNDHEDDNS